MSDQYNVFISWSGPRSKWVAEAFRNWLPVLVQAAKPWMSATDIEKGTRGLNEIGSMLRGTKVAIVCLTPENLHEPWIHYEAGALSKTIDDKTRLCTYLLGGLKFQDVKPPLGMFQATNSDKQDTRELVRTINAAVSDTPVPSSNLDVLFDRMWPDFEQKLTTMPKAERAVAPKRSLEDMVTELLEIARSEANSRLSIQEQMLRLSNSIKRPQYDDNISISPATGILGRILRGEELSNVVMADPILQSPIVVDPNSNSAFRSYVIQGQPATVEGTGSRDIPADEAAPQKTRTASDKDHKK